MLGNIYRKILNKIPAGVFVFNAQMKMIFTNDAFSDIFCNHGKIKKTLKDIFYLNGKNKKTDKCNDYVYNRLSKVMKEAIRDGKEKKEVIDNSVRHANVVDKITFRINILPLDIKKKLFLGIAYADYQTELVRDVLTASEMQKKLLPAGHITGGIPYSFMYLPCSGVGGDMVEAYEFDGQTYGIIADVSGKGIPAGMLSAFVRAGYDRKVKSIASAFSDLNDKFAETNFDEMSYITVAGVRIDKKEQKIHYSIAGHNAPILLKSGVDINEIEMPAPPISNWNVQVDYKEKEFSYKKGDILVLLTDGVTECFNASHEVFGIERAEVVLLQSSNANNFISNLRAALEVYSSGEFSDDITVIAFDL